MALTLQVNVTLFPVIADTGETVVTAIAAEKILSENYNLVVELIHNRFNAFPRTELGMSEVDFNIIESRFICLHVMITSSLLRRTRIYNASVILQNTIGRTIAIVLSSDVVRRLLRSSSQEIQKIGL